MHKKHTLPPMLLLLSGVLLGFGVFVNAQTAPEENPVAISLAADEKPFTLFDPAETSIVSTPIENGKVPGQSLSSGEFNRVLELLGSSYDGSTGIIMVNGFDGQVCLDEGGVIEKVYHGYICKFSGDACPADWKPLYDYTATETVNCVDTKNAPEGWEPKQGTTPCDTGEHAFGNEVPEECTSKSWGIHQWYSGKNKKSGYVETFTTCTANITEVGCYLDN